MESIFFHHPLDTLQRVGAFLRSIEFTELEAGGAGELVRRWIGGDSLNGDNAYEQIGDGHEAEPDAGGGRVGLRLNIGESAHSKKALHGVVKILAGERLADFQAADCEHGGDFLGRKTGEFDLVDRQAEIGGDGSELRWRFGRLLGRGLGRNLRCACPSCGACQDQQGR